MTILSTSGLVRLHLESGISKRGSGSLDADHCGEAFENIVAGDRRFLVLDEVIVLCVLINRAREGTAEAAGVRTAIGIRHSVGVTQKLFVVGIGIMQADFDDDALPRTLDQNWLWVHHGFVFHEAGHVILDAAGMDNLDGAGVFVAFIQEGEAQRGIDVCEIV